MLVQPTPAPVTELLDQFGHSYAVNPPLVDNTSPLFLTGSGRYTGSDPNDGTVAVTGPHLAISTPTTASAGVPVSVTVTAQNADNTTNTGYAGTVHFSSSDTNALMPADATLTNGVGTFGVTLATPGSQTVTVCDRHRDEQHRGDQRRNHGERRGRNPL